MTDGQPIDASAKLCTPRCRRSAGLRSSPAAFSSRWSMSTSSRGVEGVPQAEKVRLYQQVYLMALIDSLRFGARRGVAWMIQRRTAAAHAQVRGGGGRLVQVRTTSAEPTPNWWILGGGLAFVLFTLTVGTGAFTAKRSSLPAPWRSCCS